MITLNQYLQALADEHGPNAAPVETGRMVEQQVPAYTATPQVPFDISTCSDLP